MKAFVQHIQPYRYLAVAAVLLLNGLLTFAQERPSSSQIASPDNGVWLGSYLNARVSEKLFWAGEFHFRTEGYEDTPYLGRVAQIYNRHGLKYVHSKKFSATLGGVLRLNFTPRPGDDDYNTLILEPRIWHEYVFALPLERMMIYHRIRIEHRWSKSNRVTDDNYIFRNRWRYMFFMKVPLNTPSLSPGTFYFSPVIELIMQSGKPVVDSPFEDLRLYPVIGYIHSPQVSFSSGVMYTMGQELSAGYSYRSRWLFRVNCYLSLDFRKFEDRIPKSKLFD